MNREFEEIVENLWQKLSPELRGRIQRDMGFDRDRVSADQLVDYVLGYVEPKLVQLKTERLLRESIARIEAQTTERVDHAIEDLRKEEMIYLRQLEKSLTDRIEQIRKELKGYGQPSLQNKSERVALPVITFTDCIRHHFPSEKNSEVKPGPTRCVTTRPAEDGVHMHCLVAYYAQNPGDKGFARLPYQIFHAELLRQGDCPRPLSRSISRRIPGLSWLFVKPDICPLADGKEHVIEYGNK